jgi:phosphomannomutase
MKAFLAEARKTVKLGVVGGSDLHKIKEQLGDDSMFCAFYDIFCG